MLRKMPIVKEINWSNRACSCSTSKVYLFWKSFAALQNKELLQDIILSKSRLVREHGERKSSLSSDPILLYILGFEKTCPSFDAIVRFYGEGAELHQDGLPFVDLCYYLNKVEYAKKFALTHHISSDFATCESNDNLSEYSQMWLQVLEQRNEVPMEQLVNSAELLGFALRFASGEKLNVICEMAGRGYIWDAFVLMSLLYPDDTRINKLKAVVWKKHDLNWIEELNCSSSNDDPISNLLGSGLEPAYCYEQVKLCLQNNIENEFLRSTMYTQIRVCLMSAMCNDENSLAIEMAKDFIKFAATEPTVLAEFLPAMQKNYFEQAVMVMSDLIKVALQMGNVARTDSMEADLRIKQGVIQSLVIPWIIQELLPKDEQALLRSMKGIHDIIYAFIGDVVDCTKIISRGVDCKELALLALRIGEVMFNLKLGERNDSVIFGMLKNSECCQQFVQKILHGPKDTSCLPLPPLIGQMGISVYRTLYSAHKLVETQKYIARGWLPHRIHTYIYFTCLTVSKAPNTVVVAAEIFHNVPAPCCERSLAAVSELCSKSNDDASAVVTAESDVKNVSMKAESIDSSSLRADVIDNVDLSVNMIYSGSKNNDSVMCQAVNAHMNTNELDVMFEDMYSVSHTSNTNVVLKEESSSIVNPSICQSTIADVTVSSQGNDFGNEASASESSHSFTTTRNARSTSSFSPDFEDESVNIWATNKHVRDYRNGPGLTGPIGKVSGGFGGMNGDCQIPQDLQFDVAPHMAIHNRGRGGFRRGGFGGRGGGDSYPGYGSDTGYGGRGSNYRRGAYVPRGNRGGFS